MRYRVSVALLLLFSAFLYGSNWTYDLFSPEGGVVLSVIADTMAPGNPVAITSYDVYVYTNQTWELSPDMEFERPTAITTGNSGKFALISQDNKAYYSADGGVHWIPVEEFNWLGALSEVKSETLFLAADLYLYMSTNAGFSWEFHDSIGYRATAIDYSSDGNFLYVGALAHSEERDTTILLRSEDGGLTWTRIFTEPDTLDLDEIIDIEPAPDSTDWVFLCLGIGSGPNLNFLFSPDGGENWLLANVEAPDLVLPIDVEFLSNDTVLVACLVSPGIYRGTWNGSGWTFTKVDSSANFTAIDICGDVIYASSYQGVYISTDRGETWDRLNNGLHAFPLHEPAKLTNSVGNRLIYLNEFGSSIYLTANGESWDEHFLPGLVFAEAGYIAPSNSDIAYICGIGVEISDSSWAFHSIYRTEDWGNTWIPVDTSCTSPDSVNEFERLLVPPSDPYVLLGIHYDQEQDRSNLYRSEDGGHTWQEVMENVEDYLFGTDTVFVMREESLWISYDMGITWEPFTRIDWTWDIIYDHKTACVYAAQYFGVERIGLNGERDTVFTAPYQGWEDVALAVADNGVLYISFCNPGGPCYLARLRYGETSPEIDTLDFPIGTGLRVLDGAILITECGRGFRKSEDAYLGLEEHFGKNEEITLIHPTVYAGRPELTVDCEKPDVYELKIFNSAGRKVLTEKIRLKRGINRIKVKRELPSGLYVLLLESERVKIRSRFVLLRRERR